MAQIPGGWEGNGEERRGLFPFAQHLPDERPVVNPCLLQKWSKLHSSVLEASSTHSSCPGSWSRAPQLCTVLCTDTTSDVCITGSLPCLGPFSSSTSCKKQLKCHLLCVASPLTHWGVSLLLPSVPIALCILPDKPTSSLNSESNCTPCRDLVFPHIELETMMISPKAL